MPMDRTWSMLELRDLAEVQKCPGDESIIEDRINDSLFRKENRSLSCSELDHVPYNMDSQTNDSFLNKKNIPIDPVVKCLESEDGKLKGDAYEDMLQQIINSRFASPMSSPGAVSTDSVDDALYIDNEDKSYIDDEDEMQTKKSSVLTNSVESSQIKIEFDQTAKIPAMKSKMICSSQTKPTDHAFDSSESSSATSKGIKRNVSFGSLQILEFPLVLGDNPACRIGLPVTLARKHTDEKTMNLDEHELTKALNLNDPLQKKSSIYMSSFKRTELLKMGKDINEKDIMKVRKEIKTIQKSRERIIMLKQMEQAMESAVVG
eukprot:CAMPEP_0113313680 /NCGR_PEP_ID=MMETSP0010_2-20120614/10006_1 /TAXON_ID=216773 ORGANISM="Corethron hystrix, Strain 308" /NCGR_SAMPLE_ID=MMETSP0010_2 /ASSEMBLY_ACC=CAM_ASM_000155 /LENGTH=318 /DNA_ID=CAMNT_0000169739 /DNA_START=12 /DNA_END=969 /DNA_ORIENTATION=- /assembly_acc=CAM_ASM_000155